MTHTPTALKWIADKRRRVSSDFAKTIAISADVNRRVEMLHFDLAALDRSLLVLDSNIEPEKLQPVQAHKRTGKLGSLRQAIIKVLQRTRLGGWQGAG